MITLRQITLRRGVKVVLQEASVTLQPGEKVGLIGRNGAGKSSLFAMLADRLHADAGEVEMPPRWRIGEVAQEMPETDDSATAFVLQGDLPLMRAQAALDAADASGDGHAIGDAHLALDEAGGFDAPARAQALLLGLGFRPAQLEAPVNSFSGGWRMRLQLARALMCPCELLLLDEPTNHLDLDALVWLEAWLQRFNGTLVIISHDREFLDAITRVTVHLDDGALTRYGGNYTWFEEQRALRIVQAQAAFSKQQDRIAHLQHFIDRFKAKATKAKQAQSRVKALARMEKLAPVMMAGDFSFEFREPAALPNPMLTMDSLCCGYGETMIVEGISRSVLAGQRIGILGANGQGKSTLVKTIAHALAPLAGQVTEGKGLAIGYFAQQELDLLQPADGPLMHMVRLARDQGPAAREQELRDFLGRFRFTGDMVHQTVGSLSGGEKARLVLAMIVWQRPNLLLLDEPTNHLDLNTREALSIALNEFEGTVMLVSHDRALLRETCDEFWLITRGGLREFDGDLDDYQRWLLDVARAVSRGQPPPEPPQPGADVAAQVAPTARTPAAPPAPRAAAPAAAVAATPATAPAPRRHERQAQPRAEPRADPKVERLGRARRAEVSRPLRNEIQRIDARLQALAAEKLDVESKLSAPGAPADDFAELGRRLAHAQAETAMLEERWLAAHAELDELQAQAG